MVASVQKLEALLARVQRRAAEPRQPSIVTARPAAVAAELQVAQARPAPVPIGADDEIEEYDDELIEIIDDAEVKSETASRPLPLELSASAPSVELRRPAQPAPRPVEAAPPPVPAAVARPAAAPAALEAEVVQRKPIAAAAVVQAQGARPEARSQLFLELLDASLDLGA